MPSPSAQQRLFEELLSRLEPDIAKAFRAAVDDLRSNIELQRFIAAYERGDLAGAMDALHIDQAAYGPLQDALQRAYAEGGQMGAQALPSKGPDGTALVFRFNARNYRAESWLRDHSATLVQGLSDEDRTVARDFLVQRMAEGANPKATGLDLVGRIHPLTGRREGGIIGLSSRDAAWVRSFEAELSGDVPDANALTKKLRDGRFDGTIRKAIREGKPIPPEMRAKMVAAYKNRALRNRGEGIGKHEAFEALAASKHEAFRQAVESGGIPAAAVTKAWNHMANENARMQHVAMDGKRVGLDAMFILPDGTRMLYPHDSSAPASHTAGCHCQADYRVDFLAGL